ncbi:transporter substrate-binding protein [Pseudonocardia sp. MCCB 268]|nr:transporter substrate-binding protein [Pseudonocardia cytotoxica]
MRSPTSSLIDYVDWIIERIGRKIYVLGSDYVYPRSLGAIVRKVVRRRGGEVKSVAATSRSVPRTSTPCCGRSRHSRRTWCSRTWSAWSIPTSSTRRSRQPVTRPTRSDHDTVTTEFDVEQLGAEHAAGTT